MQNILYIYVVKCVVKCFSLNLVLGYNSEIIILNYNSKIDMHTYMS